MLQMDFFFRRKPWYAGQFVRKVTPKIEMKGNTALFFQTILNMQKPKLLPVLVRHVDETFRNIVVKLPVDVEGNIDFEFIESFIAELQAQRIAELQAYLSVTGLTDFALTEEERRAVEDYDTWQWRAFNLENLFGKSTRGKRLKSEDRTPGTLPFVTAGEAEEGVSAFIGNPVQVFSANTTTIDMFGSAKYRNYDYGGDDHVAVVHTEALPKHAAVFVTTAIHKSSHNGQFSYSKNFYATDADELDIMLPVKGGKPDYANMSLLISAVQKFVIRDVVRYADNKIRLTKSVVNNKK